MSPQKHVPESETDVIIYVFNLQDHPLFGLREAELSVSYLAG